MSALAVTKRRWKWLVPAVLILPAVLAAPQLLERYYVHFDRPILLSGGAVPCAEFQSELPQQSPKSCDLAVVSGTPDGGRSESFYFLDGSTLAHKLKSGKWRATSAECGAAKNGSLLAVFGMLLLGLAIVSQSVRTGQWFYFPGMKQHPLNDYETVVGIYGAIFFGGQMVAMAMATCDAMALV